MPRRKLAHDIVSRHGWLSFTPPRFRQIVLDRCKLRDFEADATIYSVGDPPGGMYGLVRGNNGSKGSIPTVWLRIGRCFKRQKSGAPNGRRDMLVGSSRRLTDRALTPPQSAPAPYRIREKISLSGAPPQAEVRKSLWSTEPASTKAIAPGASCAGNSL